MLRGSWQSTSNTVTKEKQGQQDSREDEHSPIFRILLAESTPNFALHLTVYSLRSYVAPASGSR
jgi:hypothetical protein